MSVWKGDGFPLWGNRRNVPDRPSSSGDHGSLPGATERNGFVHLPSLKGIREFGKGGPFDLRTGEDGRSPVIRGQNEWRIQETLCSFTGRGIRPSTSVESSPSTCFWIVRRGHNVIFMLKLK